MMTPNDLYPKKYIDYLFEQVEKNDSIAMILLALLYREGICVPSYPEEADWLMERALEC